jgi:hypothetical protein
MTTAIAETVSDQVVCFPGTWNLFCELLENQGDNAGLRISFDGEIIQIMSPNSPHDAYADFIPRLIYEVCREWGVRLASAGTTTRNWQAKYPDDTWIPKLGYAMLRDYEKIDSDIIADDSHLAGAHAVSLAAWLEVTYPKGQFAPK